MLVLSRRSGEEVLVPQLGIVFRILEIRGNQVRLGISAPPDIRLYRREIWEQIQPCPEARETDGIEAPIFREP